MLASGRSGRRNAQRAVATVALTLAALSGCRRAPPVRVEPVRLYVAPGLPGAVAAELARGFQIADPALVDRIGDAEVAWLRDPTEALALGGAAAPGAAPEQPGVPDAFLDVQRRFAPVGAVARVIVSAAKGAGAFAPDELRELADPRVRGEVAIPRLDRRDGALLVAALELAYGERGTLGWLGQLASNDPILAEDDADVVARVVAGTARFGLTDSLAAGAAPREALRITFTDQAGKGCVAIPTALVVLPRASPAARKLSAWLAGPVGERVLVDRVPGLLPLRAQATAPPGIVPLWQLATLSLDWSALASRAPVWEARLHSWPGAARVPPALEKAAR
jgi:iron(III) transport system substrate-binding protein